MELLSSILTHEQAVAGLAYLVGALALLAAAWARQRLGVYLTPQDLARIQEEAERAARGQMRRVRDAVDNHTESAAEMAKGQAHAIARGQVEEAVGSRLARKAGQSVLDAAIVAGVKRAKGALASVLP